MTYPCPSPGCGVMPCYRHCNHCGKDIFWRPPLLDKEIAYSGPRPLNSDGRTVHRCMRGGTIDHRFYHTESTSRIGQQKQPPPPWPLPLPEGVHLGTTHLWLQDKKEFVPLYKCPLCSFQNIHRDVINHHLKFAYDSYHNQSKVRI